MRIEKRYYLEAKKEWDLLEAQSRYDRDLQTNAKSTIQIHQAIINDQKRSPDQKKITHFKHLYEKAIFMAQCLNLDIIIEQNDDSLKGKIKLSAPCLVLDASFISEIRSVFHELVQSADYLFIQPADDMIEIICEFDLFECF